MKPKISKKAQVSFEFILLFGFVFFVFITFLNIFILGLKNTDNIKEVSETLAKEIKVKAITASLSDADFEAKIKLPKNVEVNVLPDPDNLVIIKNNQETIVRKFLPKVDMVAINSTGKTMIIKKSNQLSIFIQ